MFCNRKWVFDLISIYMGGGYIYTHKTTVLMWGFDYLYVVILPTVNYLYTSYNEE